MAKAKRTVRQMAKEILPMLQETFGEDAVITVCDIPGEDQETMYLRVEVPGKENLPTVKVRYLPDLGALAVGFIW